MPLLEHQQTHERRRQQLKQNSIYLLPNAFTIAALFFAFYAITQSMHGRFESACIAVFFSMILDGMDGRVARWTNSQSAFGEQLDSLADMVSFGVAPAIVVYTWQLHQFGKLGYCVAFIYCACTALRLALFNTLIGKVDKKWFIGIPSPTAAALIIGMVWLGCRHQEHLVFNQYIILLLTLFAGLSMVAQIKFWSFKDMKSRRVPFGTIIVFMLLLALLALEPAGVLFVCALMYSLSGYFYALWKKYKNSKTTLKNPFRQPEK